MMMCEIQQPTLVNSSTQHKSISSSSSSSSSLCKANKVGRTTNHTTHQQSTGSIHLYSLGSLYIWQIDRARRIEKFMDKAACNSTHASTPLTTFVQADTNTFRELVQRLTGPSEVADSENKPQLLVQLVENRNEVAAQQIVGMKRRPSKLHERRSQYTCSSKLLEIEKPAVGTGFHQFKAESVFSPCNKSSKSDYTTSPLGTPSKSFSKLSILEDDDQEKNKVVVRLSLNKEEEEKAIKERRFYLHPSPRSKRGYSEPELLHLFPLTSPKT